ncbi:MAG: UDP-glucuronic acid decarboxylase family protein [bacterium]|nr:UDP-glucuronic acid decarboxylase family protein [bacterium]
MRVVIAGGSGFVGSHLCERFLSEGAEVIAVDNLITGSFDNIKHLQTNPRFSFINQNISRPFTIDGAVDAVLNFASPASPPDYLKYPIETLEVGSLGTQNTLKLAHEKNARYLLASTSEVYGDPLVHPQTEDYLGNVDSIGPRSVYDEAKRYAEAITMAYHRTYGVKTRIVRIFNTYGPRMRLDDGRVVPNFIAQALRGEPLTVYGDGQQTRSFQYVDDLIEGVRRLLDSDFVEPVNIGNPNEMTILQFAEMVAEIVGKTATIEFHDARIKGDPQTRRPEISRAKAILNWEPKVPLADGLAKTIAYYRNVV